MEWKTVRLELAQTPDFPKGSASRAYLLRVPLDPDGNIDEAELQRTPEHATVRRFWPSQRDVLGYLVRQPDGWGVSLDGGDVNPEAGTFHIGNGPLQSGACISIVQPDGRPLPFRVARINQLLPA